MTNPLGEDRLLQSGDYLSDVCLTLDGAEPTPPDPDSVQAWRLLRQWRHDLASRPAPTDGVAAWRHVEELLDLALAERAQRTVDRILARKRTEDT